MINNARAPIHEENLPELLERNVGKRLRASADLHGAVGASDITFIAVGTPAVDGRIGLQYIERAAVEIGQALRAKRDYHTVVVKSTVIPGTTDTVVRNHVEAASGKRAGAGFGLGMNPEFLTEGTAVRDFLQPDRLVLGGIDGRTHDVLSRLYDGFQASVPRIVTNNRTAEMIKYASNVTLATMISLANELGRLCSAVGGVDVADVTRGVHKSAYFTSRLPSGENVLAPIASFLEAGCGFGGSCLPKDVTALIAQGRDLGLGMPLLSSVLEINRSQPDEMMRLIGKHYPSLQGQAVTVLGLAFKPDTDDVRESPAFGLIRRLKDAGARVTAYDPVARPPETGDLAGVRRAESLKAAIDGAEIIVLATRWKEFQELPRLLERNGRRPLVVDGRRVLDPATIARYEGIGR
jgi:UDPglucose 6-dehydrogenase/GDP-mannose 6-dehydrogenase